MAVPTEPKIYHMVHVDRLASILADGNLWCDTEINRRMPAGSTIGMNKIKQRRLTELTLTSHPDLHVGDCVPFYFCPRSVMLYVIHQANHPELTYRGGQGPIIHLEADLHEAVDWLDHRPLKWAFTLSTAGATYFEDRCDLVQWGDIDWDSVQATQWSQCREKKQAEFLAEHRFPWELIQRVGVPSVAVYHQVATALQAATHKPRIEVKPDWYY